MQLKKCMKELNPCDPNISFTYEYIRERVSFLDLEVDIMKSKLITSLSWFLKRGYPKRIIDCKMKKVK